MRACVRAFVCACIQVMPLSYSKARPTADMVSYGDFVHHVPIDGNSGQEGSVKQIQCDYYPFRFPTVTVIIEYMYFVFVALLYLLKTAV